ncbi:hypothetical protein WKW77_05210 [Variovorax ureilyticus]|uniref:Lipoprotein n=1 Tax=Variovorax ureilyticus TaxID=1836198 RepID=A0ABU8V9X5_9BURK
MNPLVGALLLCAVCALYGCAGSPSPRSYPVCATDPGGYACQIERYQNVD